MAGVSATGEKRTDHSGDTKLRSKEEKPTEKEKKAGWRPGSSKSTQRRDPNADVPDDMVKALLTALVDQKFLPKGVLKKNPQERRAAMAEGIEAFQKKNGLQVTGRFDDDVMYGLTDPQNWRRD